MQRFKDFMNEKHIIDRWMVLVIALAGAFAGCLFTVAFIFSGLGG